MVVWVFKLTRVPLATRPTSPIWMNPPSIYLLIGAIVYLWMYAMKNVTIIKE